MILRKLKTVMNRSTGEKKEVAENILEKLFEASLFINLFLLLLILRRWL